MKKIIVTIMVLSMMLAAMAAMAQGEKNFTITPRIAANFATQKDSLDNKQGNQYGLLLDFNWASFPIGAEIGYMYAGTKNQQTFTLDGVPVSFDCKVKTNDIPILATYNYNFTDSFYGILGAGIAIKNTHIGLDNWSSPGYEVEDVYGSENQTKVHFAWQAGLGYKFGQNWSVEVKYWDQGKTRFNKGTKTDIDYYEYKGSYVQFNVGYSF